MDKPRKPETEKRSPPEDENEGEGSKTADRNYREHVREFEEEHDVEALGRAARRDIERDPQGYRAAEQEGRRHIAEEDPELYKKGEKK
jgi:hypothetical protein